MVNTPRDCINVEMVAVAQRKFDHVKAAPKQPGVDIILLEKTLNLPRNTQ